MNSLKKLFPIFLVLVLASMALAASPEFAAVVVAVADGDTLTVENSLGVGRQVVRLAGIDAPELSQPYGIAAKQYATQLTLYREVTVRVIKSRDRYGRLVAEVILTSGASLNQEMVRAGLAWWFRRYAPQDKTLAHLEEEARAARHGLWAEPHPQPPWEHRR
jgi:endonuclease YncB( thermonuclease family)